MVGRWLRVAARSPAPPRPEAESIVPIRGGSSSDVGVVVGQIVAEPRGGGTAASRATEPLAARGPGGASAQCAGVAVTGAAKVRRMAAYFSACALGLWWQ